MKLGSSKKKTRMAYLVENLVYDFVESFELVEFLFEVGGALDVAEDHGVDVHRLLVAVQRERVLLPLVQSVSHDVLHALLVLLVASHHWTPIIPAIVTEKKPREDNVWQTCDRTCSI